MAAADIWLGPHDPPWNIAISVLVCTSVRSRRVVASRRSPLADRQRPSAAAHKTQLRCFGGGGVGFANTSRNSVMARYRAH